MPFRTDLPRTLTEFAVLGVYEADPGLRAAVDATPEDVTGLCFDHYPRPGQGSISGRPTLGLELVLISPRASEEAQALRDWADFVHIRRHRRRRPDHFSMITPYQNRRSGIPPLHAPVRARHRRPRAGLPGHDPRHRGEGRGLRDAPHQENGGATRRWSSTTSTRSDASEPGPEGTDPGTSTGPSR